MDTFAFLFGVMSWAFIRKSQWDCCTVRVYGYLFYFSCRFSHGTLVWVWDMYDYECHHLVGVLGGSLEYGYSIWALDARKEEQKRDFACIVLL